MTSAITSGGSTTFQGTVSTASLYNGSHRVVRIEFFGNPTPGPGELAQGKVYLGFTKVTTDNNGNATFTVTVPTPSSAGSVFTSTATPDGGVTSSFSSGIHGTTTNSPAADLSVTGTATPGPLMLGDRLTYSLTVHNDGPDPAAGVLLTDTLPSGVTFVSADPAPAGHDGSNLYFTFDTIASGTSKTVTIVVTTAQSGLLTNTETVVSPDGPADPVQGNNTATQATTVDPAPVIGPDLGVVISVPPGTVHQGQDLVYTITVTNHGSGAATGVMLDDALPPGSSAASMSSSQGTFTSSPGTVAARWARWLPVRA